MSDELVDDVVESEGRHSMTDLLENANDREVRMILGDRERIRPAGKIRPGIMAPLSWCTSQQKAIYEKGLAANVGFDAIDTEMLKLEKPPSTKKTCLRPANCDYFVVRDDDFTRSSDAELVRSRYADADGKVRRIPVWFSMSERHRAIPHAFTAFDGGGNLRCVSFYDGETLKFRYLPREVKVAKLEDWKVLDSRDEDEATKACGLKVSLTGAYHVQVPGVKSVGGVLVNTKSWYGLSDAMAVLKEVRRILGRFDGLFQGTPFFELVKVQQSMKVEGKTTKQWIVTLELTVDLMEMARYAEPSAVTARAAHSMSLLTGKQSLAPVRLPEPVALPPAAETKPEHTGGETPEFDRAKAVAALGSLCTPYNLTSAHIEGYAASLHGGQTLDELSREDMLALYHNMKGGLIADAIGFCEKVLSICGEVP